jgi:hypothetical protein
MRQRVVWTAILGLCAATAVGKEWVSGIVWPEPKVIVPGSAGSPPSDAVVLFDGTSLNAWHNGEKWHIADGVATVQGGGISTKDAFGDCQLHLEWATPSEVSGSGQGRGNSGIFFGGRYEVQILDSYENVTYFDGQAAAVYKTKPPLVNASRGPGEWQTYDIIYHAPRFDPHGNLLKPGYLTVLHNGVLVQDHTELLGTTAWDSPPRYEPHDVKQPLSIQDHGNPMRFRNIWVRELIEPSPQRPE